MKNKKLVLLAVMVLLLAIVLVWCSNSQTAEAPETTTEAPAQPTEATTLEENEGDVLIDADEVRPTAENQERDDVPVEEPQATEATEAADVTEATEPEATEPETTQPATEPAQQPPVNTSCGCEYERYMSMSAEAQEAYMNSFPSPLDFINWCQNAEAEHAGHNTVTNVTGGDLDISDFIG